MQPGVATQLRTVFTFDKLETVGIKRVEQYASRQGLRTVSDVPLGFVKVLATVPEIEQLEEALNQD